MNGVIELDSTQVGIESLIEPPASWERVCDDCNLIVNGHLDECPWCAEGYER